MKPVAWLKIDFALTCSTPRALREKRGRAGHSVLANARHLPHNTTRSPPRAGLPQYTPVQEPAPGETAVRTGMNLLLWATHVTEEHFPLLGKLKKTGFDGVEIPLFA